MSTFAWPYYTLSNGRLFDEAGRRAFPRAPRFVTTAEAEIWLEHQDERGNVRALTERQYPFHSNELGGRSAWATDAYAAYLDFIAAGALPERAIALAIAEADANAAPRGGPLGNGESRR